MKTLRLHGVEAIARSLWLSEHIPHRPAVIRCSCANACLAIRRGPFQDVNLYKWVESEDLYKGNRFQEEADTKTVLSSLFQQERIEEADTNGIDSKKVYTNRWNHKPGIEADTRTCLSTLESLSGRRWSTTEEIPWKKYGRNTTMLDQVSVDYGRNTTMLQYEALIEADKKVEGILRNWR
ncbi:hypothetical protein LXL04_000959 [Taraxacum kok-saghyz]